MNRKAVVAVIVMALALTAGPAPGLQQQIRIRGNATGSVTAQRIMTLGARGGPDEVVGLGTMSQDSRGRFFMSSIHLPHEIRVYDRTGAFVRRLGGKGEGVGEYRWIFGLEHGRSDTLYVFDTTLSRVTTLTPDGAVERVSKLPLTSLSDGPVSLGGGRFVVPASVGTRDRAGYPLHIINLNGEIERSFGADRPVFRRDRPYLTRRIITRARDGVWAAHRARYRLELWGPDAQLKMSVDRDAGWFKPYDNQGPFTVSRDVPPPPSIVDVHEDTHGRLWVMLHVAGENWRQAVGGERTGPQGIRSLQITDPDLYYSTLLEVLDIRSGTVLARARIHPGGFLNNGDVASYREDSEGHPYFDIWRFELSQPSARRSK